jgi:hypothetical protein
MATTNYSWVLPVVGGSTDTWGAITNAAFESVDGDLKTVADDVGARALKSDNLSDLASASTARTNLGLAIGTDVQAFDATLAALAGLTTAANKAIYATAADTFATFTISSTGRNLVGGADAGAMRTTLGLGTMATQAASNYGTLSGANTWTSAQTLSAGATSRGDTVMRVDVGTDTNSGRVTVGSASPGTLAIGEIYLQHA